MPCSHWNGGPLQAAPTAHASTLAICVTFQVVWPHGPYRSGPHLSSSVTHAYGAVTLTYTQHHLAFTQVQTNACEHRLRVGQQGTGFHAFKAKPRGSKQVTAPFPHSRGSACVQPATAGILVWTSRLLEGTRVMYTAGVAQGLTACTSMDRPSAAFQCYSISAAKRHGPPQHESKWRSGSPSSVGVYATARPKKQMPHMRQGLRTTNLLNPHNKKLYSCTTSTTCTEQCQLLRGQHGTDHKLHLRTCETEGAGDNAQSPRSPSYPTDKPTCAKARSAAASLPGGRATCLTQRIYNTTPKQEHKGAPGVRSPDAIRAIQATGRACVTSPLQPCVRAERVTTAWPLFLIYWAVPTRGGSASVRTSASLPLSTTWGTCQQRTPARPA